jgi:transposase
VLAELAKGRLRAKLPQLRQALRGRFGAHHALLVRLAWRTSGQLEGSIAELDAQIDRVLTPVRLRPGTGQAPSPGWASGPRRRSLPSSGWTPRCSPPPRTSPSWAGRCPGNNLTGGKRRSGKPTKGNRWLGEVLIRVRLGGGAQPRQLPVGPVLAARPAHRQAGRQPSRWGTQVLVIAWHLLANDCNYQDLGGEDFIRRDTDRQRQRAIAQLQALGYRVALQPLAA